MRTAVSLPEADVVSRPMGSPGMDILLSQAAQAKIPFAIEVKCQEKVNVWASFNQACANATETLKPLLVISKNRTEPLVVMKFEDFLKWLASGQ